MAQYDGSIRIGTGIDTSGIKKDSKELEKELKNLADAQKSFLEAGGSITSPVYQEYEKEVKALQSALESLKKTQDEEAEPQKDEHWNQLKIDVEEYAKSLKELQDQGKFFGDEEYDKVYLAWKNATDAVKEYQAELNKQTESGKAKIAEQEAKATERKEAAQRKAEEQAEKALQRENERIQKQIENEAKLQAKEAERQAKIQEEAAEEERLNQIRANAVASNDEIIAKVERIKQLEQEIADLKAVNRTEGYADYDDRIKELSGLKQDVTEYRHSLSEVPEKFSRMRAAAQKAFNAIHAGLSTVGNIGKKAFSVIMSGTKKSSGLLSTFSSRLKGMAMSLLIFNWISKAFNAMISGMKKGFENLMEYSDAYAQSVQSMKNAMATLGNQFAAAFSPIVQMVIPWLNSLINALTVAMTKLAQFIAVLNGKSTFTRAKQIQDKYNKSLNGTAKAADKARGALAAFDDLDVLEKKDTEEVGQTLPEDMFEEAPIESSMQNLIRALKDFVYGEDWEGLGSYVAEKFSDGLKKIYDIINWDNIGPQIAYFVNAFTEAFNGLVDGFNWEQLGKTIGAGVNTVVNTLNLLITGIDWKNLGAGLANSANGLADEVNFTNLGNLIGEKFMIIPRMLLGFVSNLEWGDIGTETGNALNGVVESIKLSEIGEMLGKGLTGIFQAAINFSATFDWKGLGTNIYEGINSFFNNTDWAVVGKGISDFVLGLLDTLITVIDGTDWQQVGASIVELISSIDWIGLAGRIAVSLLDLFVAAFDLFMSIRENLAGSLADWFESIGLDGIAGFFRGMQENLANMNNWIKENIFDPFIGWIKKLFGIHSPSTVMAEIGVFIMKGLLNGISSLVDSVKEIWNNLKTSTLNIFNGIWTGIKNVINSILGGVEKMANGVVDAVNAVIRALNGLSFDIPEFDVFGKKLGGTTIGFNIAEIPNVSIPRLATGAVIRGGNPFMAILGDQPAGRTNIEAPADLIREMARQGIREELAGMNFANVSSGQTKVILNVNGVDMGEAIIDDLFSVMQRRGYDVDVLGVT